jgi:hypothetical protein
MRLGFIMVRIDPNDKLMLSSFLASKQGFFFFPHCRLTALEIQNLISIDTW